MWSRITRNRSIYSGIPNFVFLQDRGRHLSWVALDADSLVNIVVGDGCLLKDTNSVCLNSTLYAETFSLGNCCALVRCQDTTRAVELWDSIIGVLIAAIHDSDSAYSSWSVCCCSLCLFEKKILHGGFNACYSRWAFVGANCEPGRRPSFWTDDDLRCPHRIQLLLRQHTLAALFSPWSI